MGSNWRPDDSFIDSEGGQMKGVKRAKEAQQRHGVEAGGIITSRDRGVREAQDELKRTTLPPGFEQWQLPLALGPKEDAVAFITEGAAGSLIPKHSHRCDLFRLVVRGSIKTAGRELRSGDWMYVREGEEYEIEVGPEACIIFHMYW